jgi:hypothetical protein
MAVRQARDRGRCGGADRKRRLRPGSHVDGGYGRGQCTRDADPRVEYLPRMRTRLTASCLSPLRRAGGVFTAFRLAACSLRYRSCNRNVSHLNAGAFQVVETSDGTKTGKCRSAVQQVRPGCAGCPTTAGRLDQGDAVGQRLPDRGQVDGTGTRRPCSITARTLASGSGIRSGNERRRLIAMPGPCQQPERPVRYCLDKARLGMAGSTERAVRALTVK